MTPDEFRRVVLSMPNTTERAHMGHPDFRVDNKIFATLGYPDENWGMVKLTREQQDMIVATKPELFKPAKGAWGRQGSTLVFLEALDQSTAGSAVRMAWENVAS